MLEGRNNDQSNARYQCLIQVKSKSEIRSRWCKLKMHLDMDSDGLEVGSHLVANTRSADSSTVDNSDRTLPLVVLSNVWELVVGVDLGDTDGWEAVDLDLAVGQDVEGGLGGYGLGCGLASGKFVLWLSGVALEREGWREVESTFGGDRGGHGEGGDEGNSCGGE